MRELLPRRVADWPEPWREQYEERAAIIEYLANLPRWEAEHEAEKDIRKAAWESIT